MCKPFSKNQISRKFHSKVSLALKSRENKNCRLVGISIRFALVCMFIRSIRNLQCCVPTNIFTWTSFIHAFETLATSFPNLLSDIWNVNLDVQCKYFVTYAHPNGRGITCICIACNYRLDTSSWNTFKPTLFLIMAFRYDRQRSVVLLIPWACRDESSYNVLSTE